MAFRTLEISRPAEIHLRQGQIEITNEDGIFMIPVEDIHTIICSGPGIRMSTMAQAQIAEAGVSIMVINEKYHPSCVVMPIESNVRQSLVLRNQIAMTEEAKNSIWLELIMRKIENQARVLTLLGREGAEQVIQYSIGMTPETVDYCEANAAREYFHHLHPGLNRRNEDPVNSCLNYGYAVLRNAIIRSAVLAGLQASLGIHQNNYLNSFNLADDLIEPWRPFVDLIAADDPGTSIALSRSKRREIAMVLHQACLLDGRKLSVITGIDEMVSDIRGRIVAGTGPELKLPVVIPLEVIEAVRE